MTPNQILDEIISGLTPEEVPGEYVVMAKLTDVNGHEHVVQGAEFDEIMADLFRHRITEARVLIDVPKLRNALITRVNAIYEAVNDLYEKRLEPGARS